MDSVSGSKNDNEKNVFLKKVQNLKRSLWQGLAKELIFKKRHQIYACVEFGY